MFLEGLGSTKRSIPSASSRTRMIFIGRQQCEGQWRNSVQ